MTSNDEFLGVFWGALLVGLFIMGIIGVVVARAKNRSDAEGFWFGLLLGPLGLVIVALLPSRSSVEAEDSLRPCPYCAEKIQSAARVCRFCNREVEPALDTPAGVNESSGPGDEGGENPYMTWLVLAAFVGALIFFFING